MTDTALLRIREKLVKKVEHFKAHPSFDQSWVIATIIAYEDALEIVDAVVLEAANNYYRAIDDKFYCAECHAERGKDHFKSTCLAKIAQEILDRPEVVEYLKAIMEGK